MGSGALTPFSLFVLSLLSLHLINGAAAAFAAEATSKLYIVYMGEKQHDDPDLVTASHHTMLTSLLGSKEKALDSIVYSYRYGFSGFAATLTQPQAKEIAGWPGVISVEPSRTYKLQTSRSWDFLGLHLNQPTGLLRQANYGEGAIIGVVDSGIWPESKSFDDRGLGPIPSRWKGTCHLEETFGSGNCSKKIIGARWYTGGIDPEDLEGDYMSPRDFNNHGTHTASTAAGVIVPNASYSGLAGGTIRGGAPRARLAIYKACWGGAGKCGVAAVIKAIDDAIHDGVDVISLSLGGDGFPTASLHAVSRGIPLVFAGGNEGPGPMTVGNSLPWVITVAASTIDRSFPTIITLGNGLKLVGQSLFTGDNKFRELVVQTSCGVNSLNKTEVVGKVVLCYPLSNVAAILPRFDLATAIVSVVQAGAKGLIYAQYTIDLLDYSEQCGNFPCVSVDFELAGRIVDYGITIGNANRVPMVKVSPARTVIGSEVLSPRVGTFSSRGPSPQFPDLLKPDIAAPGVSILAARKDGFYLDSGTSMATPHVSGIVALLKVLHPDWSPAAIKSALITTASTTDSYGVPIEANGVPRKVADPFDYGGGQVDPNRAADPGLVYDSNPMDYAKLFNCSFGQFDYCYSSQRPLYDINLPSVSIPGLKQEPVAISRTVTNVGEVNAVYKAVLHPPPGIKMAVEPLVLVFDAKTKTHSFKITFKCTRKVQGGYTFGSLTWIDGGAHSVRIPIAVRPVIKDFYGDAS